MNDLTIDTGGALAIADGTDLTGYFRTDDAIETMLSSIEAEVRSHVPDLGTAKGRDAIKSLAYKVSRSKTALDEAGKALNEAARAQIDAVDAKRRMIRGRLDALRDEARKPLDDWEAAEKARIDRIKAALDAMRNHGMGPDDSSAAIHAKAAEISAVVIDDGFAEFRDQAVTVREAALFALGGLYASATAREEQAAELARLREQNERLERDRAEREAAERFRAEAEERAEREKAEAARIEREKAEAAERARRDAEERAAREKVETEERHRREIEEARRREEEAARRERDRIAAEARAAEQARLAREADAANRSRVKRAIVDAMQGMTRGEIAEALMAGQIPHCEVKF